jgi:hypothetical protein
MIILNTDNMCVYCANYKYKYQKVEKREEGRGKEGMG